MKKYNEILVKIAEELNIKRYSGENDVGYKSRIVYSAIGKIGLTSLLDKDENDDSISVNHFKKKTKNILSGYIDLYPEINFLNELNVEQIYDLYRECGYIYHTPHRAAVSVEKSAIHSNVRLVRGNVLTEKAFMSGLGFYSFNADNCCGLENICDMFGIETIPLNEVYRDLELYTEWNSLSNNFSKTEFLNLNSPQKNGYWSFSPQKSSAVSLMRVGEKGQQQYYLYKYKNNTFFVSQLPGWRVNNNEYLSLANAVLFAENTLPPMRIKCLDTAVYIKLGYLLPRALQNFFELYSWPVDFRNNSYSFERIMQKDVFEVFKDIVHAINIEMRE